MQVMPQPPLCPRVGAGAEFSGGLRGWRELQRGGTEGGRKGRRLARECSALLLSPARLLLRESCQGEWSGHLISPYKFN